MTRGRVSLCNQTQVTAPYTSDSTGEAWLFCSSNVFTNQRLKLTRIRKVVICLPGWVKSSLFVAWFMIRLMKTI